MPHHANALKIVLGFGMAFVLSSAAPVAAQDASAALVGDPARGEVAFEPCRPCHEIGRGAEHRSGPHLNSLFGRAAGHVEGYASSMPMVFAGERGLIWSEETLSVYLSDPQKLAPGSEMPLVGVLDAQERADLIAFLKSAADEATTDAARPEPVLHPARPRSYD